MCISLGKTETHLWPENLASRQAAQQVQWRIQDFSSKFKQKLHTYYSTYCYVTWQDTKALHSPSHKDLQDASKTEKAFALRWS